MSINSGNRYPFIIRLIAALTLISFSFPNPLHAQLVSPTLQITNRSISEIRSISIPADLGKIQETFESPSQGPVVVILQDAHSIPDAQRSIQKLIGFFQKEYGTDLVALEGAASDLDPQIFRSFPNKELLKKIFEQYFDRGELAGATAAAIFNETPAVYHGIEDWTLYEEGLRYFLDTMEMEEEIKARLNKFFGELEKEKDKTYSKDLLDIDHLLKGFHKNAADIITVIEKLAKIQPPEKDSELALLYEEIGRKDENNSSIEIEVKRIADQIKRSLEEKYSDSKQDLLEFNQRNQEFQTGRVSAENLALFLKDMAMKHRIRVKVSKRLNYLVGNQKRMKDIQGTKLFDDFEKYSRSVKASLFQNEKEKMLDAQNHELELLERLSGLQLSREDWNEVKNTLVDAIQFQDDSANNPATSLLREMKPHLNFYRNAEKRDHAFIDQMNTLIQKHKSKSILFVAGGFHAEGITYRLKAEGISYLLTMPKINRMPEESHYREQMKGDVSWGDYFEVRDGKVDLYTAFIRGTRDLLLKMSKEQRGTVLKSWRDKIIRDLAEQGKLVNSGQYTHFIDEVSEDGKKIEQVSAWEANIRRFVDRLSNLRSKGQITEENIAKLFNPASIPAGATAAPIARSELRADLLPGLKNVSEVEAPRPAATKPSARAETRNSTWNDVIDGYQISVPNEDLEDSIGVEQEKEFLRQQQAALAQAFKEAGIPEGSTVRLHIKQDGEKRVYKFSIDLGARGRKNFELSAKLDGTALSQPKFRSYSKGKIDLDQIDTAAFRTVGGIRQLFRKHAGVEVPRRGTVRVALESENDRAQILTLTTVVDGQEVKLKVVIEKGTGAVSVENYQDLGGFKYESQPHAFGVATEAAPSKEVARTEAAKPSPAVKAPQKGQEMRTAMGMPLPNAAPQTKNGKTGTAEIKSDVKANSKQVTIGQHSIFIDNDLLSNYAAFGFKSEEEFSKFLQDYLTERIRLDPPANRELVIGVLDGSESLFESHVSDGFIGIHRSLFEKLQAFPKTAQKMLIVGLNHELSHESLYMETRVLVEHYQSQGMSYQDAVRAAEAFIQQNRDNMKEALEAEGLWDTVEARMLDEDLKLAEQMALDMKQVVASGVLPESAPFANRYITEERSAFGDFLKDHIEVQDEKYGLVDPSHPLYQEINDIFQRILKAAGLDGERIKLHLMNSDEVNAYWIVDSRSFFLSLGLIKTLEKYLRERGKTLSRDMIAWILAHEVRHLLQDLEGKEKIADVESRDRRTMSQNREYDADTGALFIAAFAGFNPNASVEVLGFLDAMGDIPFLVDHPKADNRTGEVQKILQSPDQFLPNVAKPHTPFSEKFMKDPLMQGQNKASEKYEKMTAAKNLDELAAEMSSIEDLSFFEEWMMYYYLALAYGLSAGIAQDPAFRQYVSFLLEANNVVALVGANQVGQAGRWAYEREWGVPVPIANLFRFFTQTQQTSSSAPIPVLGQDPHLNRQAILDFIDKKIDEDLATYETVPWDEGKRKAEILRVIKKQFRGLLAQAGTRNVQRTTKSKSMKQAFVERKAFASREEAERTVGADWILEVGSPRRDGSILVTYIDRQAFSENFEQFWEYFEDQYDRETVGRWRDQGRKAGEIEMLGLKEWFRKKYGALELPEILFDLEVDKTGDFSDEDRARVENGRDEFFSLYLRFLAFHFFMNKQGPFAKAETTAAPAAPHKDKIENKVRELVQKQYGNRLSGKAIDLLTRVKYLAMFRAHQADFDQAVDDLIGQLSGKELDDVLQDLLSSPPYYLSSMPGQVSNMLDYQDSVGQFQKRFSSYYSEIIRKVLERKAATQGLNLTDLRNLFSLRTKIQNRFSQDISQTDAFKGLLDFAFSELLKAGNGAALNLLITEVGIRGDPALTDILFKYLVEKHFDKRDYKSKIELHGRLFPSRSELRNSRLETVLSTVDYESMDDATKKDFLENFLPLFATDKNALSGTSEEKRALHQQLSYDYMMLLKKEGMGLVEMIEKMDSVNAVVTQFDLIVANQKEWKALSFADARKIISIIKKSKNGYQEYQEALGSIALTKIKPGISPFVKTKSTQVSGRVKRPSGKIEDVNFYQEAMEDQNDYKEYLSRLISSKGQDLFAGMSYEESVQLVLELLPMSKERDEMLLELYNRTPSAATSPQTPALLEGFIPLEPKGELPDLLSISAKPAISEEAIYAYLDYEPFNVIEDPNLIDLDSIMAKVESKIPAHLKGKPEIQAALAALRKRLENDKAEFTKAAAADKSGATATKAGQFSIGGSSRIGWLSSINHALRDFVLRYLIQDNPHFDYLNLRNFGYQYDKSLEILWRVYSARKSYFLNPSIPIEERLQELMRLFPNRTPLRDNLIANLIALEEQRLAGFPVKTLVQKVNLIGIKYYDFELVTSEFDMNNLTPEQAQALIDFYKKMIPLMSDGTRQIVLGRKIFELQKKFFPQIFQDFDQGLQEILSIFPKFSLARDSVLNEFINMGAVRNFQQLNQVRRYILEEQRLTTEKDIVHDAQRNELWNTLNKLPSRKEKADLILWLLAPERPLPESLRRLSGHHHINFDSLPSVILSMTRGERDKFFYDALRGYNGLFDIQVAKDQDEARQVFEKFVNELFDSFFAPDELGDATAVLKDIFRSIFLNYSTDRRILLFNSLLNAFITSREQRQGRGQKIRTILESMGVTGVKVGQYLSEQPELFKDARDVQEELKNLKKDAAPFHLRAIFQLLQEAGLLEEIPSLGQRLGSASIKQVYEVLMKNGQKAAGKFLRPAAEKFLEEDLVVLEATVRMINENHPEIALPEKMVDEVRGLVLEELSFKREVANAKKFGENLAARSSQKQGNFTVKVPQVFNNTPYVIIEEIVNGITIADLILLQKDPSALSQEEQRRRQKIEGRFTQEELEAFRRYDINEILKAISQEFFQQAFGEGFFHADLHYGNAMITPNNEIYMIDLGATGRMDAAQTQSLLMLTVALELGRVGLATSILDSFLAKPISSNPAAQREFADLIKANVPLEIKLMNIIKFMERNKLGANRDLAVYLKALASVAPAFESLSDKEKRKLVSSYLTFGSKLKLGVDWVKSMFGGRSELREQVNETAQAVVEALNPESGITLNRSELRQVYEFSTSDFDGFTDALIETWVNRTEKVEVPEENLGVAQAAMDESERLIDHLRASREAEALPTGSITIGLRLSVQDNTSFLAQLFKVLQTNSDSAEILAEADAVKNLPVTKDGPNVAVRPVKPMDWTRGFKALRSEQEDVPVALDVKLMNEQMEGMFNGILLNWGDAKPQRLVEDFGQLLFAVTLVEMAKIFADPAHKAELELRKADPKAKADYLKTQLLQRLADLGYPQEMFAFGPNGYLTIQGIVATAYLEMKARAEVRKAA